MIPFKARRFYLSLSWDPTRFLSALYFEIDAVPEVWYLGTMKRQWCAGNLLSQSSLPWPVFSRYDVTLCVQDLPHTLTLACCREWPLLWVLFIPPGSSNSRDVPPGPIPPCAPGPPDDTLRGNNNRQHLRRTDSSSFSHTGRIRALYRTNVFCFSKDLILIPRCYLRFEEGFL